MCRVVVPPEVVEALLVGGADKVLKNNEGLTARDIAEKAKTPLGLRLFE